MTRVHCRAVRTSSTPTRAFTGRWRARAATTSPSSLLGELNDRIRVLRIYDFTTDDRIGATIAEHLEIVGCVLARDADAAAAFMRAHVQRSALVVRERVGEALARMFELPRRLTADALTARDGTMVRLREPERAPTERPMADSRRFESDSKRQLLRSSGHSRTTWPSGPQRQHDEPHRHVARSRAGVARPDTQAGSTPASAYARRRAGDREAPRPPEAMPAARPRGDTAAIETP